MLIVNANSLPSSIIFRCSKKVGEYIIKHYKIPVLSIEDGNYLFANTHELKTAIDNLPLWLKIFNR